MPIRGQTPVNQNHEDSGSDPSRVVRERPPGGSVKRQRGVRASVDEPVEVPGYEVSDHAIGVLAEREIQTTWVVRVLAAPERTQRDRSDAELMHALGRIAERDGRVLRVVYNAAVRPPRIVTVYFDRRERGKT